MAGDGYAGWRRYVRNPHVRSALVVAVTLMVYAVIKDRDLYSDEVFHYPSIVCVARGDCKVHGALTMIPGYHYLCGGLSRLLRDQSVALVRFYSVLFGLGAVWASARLGRALRPKADRFAVAQTFLLPIALPYYALIYTDILSLFLVLCGLGSWIAGRRWLGAFVLTLGMAVRQTNVIWLLFVVAYVAFSSGRFDYSLRHVARLGRRTLLALIGIALFGAFVWINGGIAVGSVVEHRVRQSVGNIYFFLSVYFFLFLPTNLYVLWKNRREFSDVRLGLLLVFAFVLYRQGYRLDSHLNHIRGFLRNETLLFFERDEAWQLAFFVPVALSLAVLYRTRLKTWGSYALYPTTILLLMPTTLIEHRYYIVPMALLTLLRTHETDVVEGVTTAFAGAISAYFVAGIGLGTLNL